MAQKLSDTDILIRVVPHPGFMPGLTLVEERWQRKVWHVWMIEAVNTAGKWFPEECGFPTRQAARDYRKRKPLNYWYFRGGRYVQGHGRIVKYVREEK